MYEVLEEIYVASTIRESMGNLPPIVQIGQQPLFERSSVFVPEVCASFDCMYKNAPELYKCNCCGFEVYLKVNLKVHMEMVHHLEIPMSLDSFRSFSDETYNLSNILKCYSCEHCDFKTYSLLVLLKHQLKHRKLLKNAIFFNKRKIVTPVARKRKYEKSMLYSKQPDCQWFDCEQCSFTTRWKFQLKYHIQLNHRLPEDGKLYECNQCSFKAVLESKLKLHQLRHRPDVEQLLFKCNQCCHRTRNKRLLNSHVMYKHTEDEKVRRFNCSQCPYKAKQRYTLNMHIVAKHTSEEKINWFMCEICSFRCKRMTNLKQHMVRHSENKMILCEMCSAQFKRVGNLKQHMKCKHNKKM